MTFKSLLFPKVGNDAQINREKFEMPAFFNDLNLNQIVEVVVSGKEQYNLRPFFCFGPVDMETISFRQQIFQDLESEELFVQIGKFAASMQQIREQLAALEKVHYKYQKERFFIDIVETYCSVITTLAADLSNSGIKSKGMNSFREYIDGYIQSTSFGLLLKEINEILSGLATVQYNILIDGLRVQVTKFNNEPDYSNEVEKTFAKFKQGEAKNYLSKLPQDSLLNDMESQVLEGVAQLYPAYFSSLDNFFENNRHFIDDLIVVFDREVQFYISYLDHLKKFRNKGLKFCYPKVSSSKQHIYSTDGFDLALANNLLSEAEDIVTNDFYLRDNERIIVVSGPNQGGKTTFARTFGQLHFLAGIGCPVPGSKAELFHYDQLFTHFEREENLKDLHGKLLDELVRIHEILQDLSTDSIVIINEIFTSTTLHDQVSLSQRIMSKMEMSDCYCVWVTFIDELASFSSKNVSMVSTVVPENTAFRTFKLIRQKADGLAYALSIAGKYGLTYASLKQRLNNERVSVK
jgi:DNA mismatch repair ATPase MutS